MRTVVKGGAITEATYLDDKLHGLECSWTNEGFTANLHNGHLISKIHEWDPCQLKSDVPTFIAQASKDSLLKTLNSTPTGAHPTAVEHYTATSPTTFELLDLVHS